MLQKSHGVTLLHTYQNTGLVLSCPCPPGDKRLFFLITQPFNFMAAPKVHTEKMGKGVLKRYGSPRKTCFSIKPLCILAPQRLHSLMLLKMHQVDSLPQICLLFLSLTKYFQVKLSQQSLVF